MNPNFNKQLFEQGASLIILDLPEGTEFGIDLQSWNIGNKFKGIKMIPPGLHFVYFSIVSKHGEVAPRTGFFHQFELKEMLVKKYNPLDEDLYDEEDAENLERMKLNLRDFDSNLGPYPMESWTKWISLTQHIDKMNAQRMEPLTRKICSAPELINEDSLKMETDDKLSSPSCKKKENSVKLDSTTKQPIPKLPPMITRPGTEIRFTKLPEKPYKNGASAAEISRGSIDSSYTMSCILQKLDKPESLLSEIQFSFICFLVGQVWDAWEHWRSLTVAMCKAEETLIQNPSLYSKFLSILHYQVQEVPEDLFADIVENENFLVTCLRTLFANILDNISSLPAGLVSKADKFRRHLVAKFGWNLNLEEEEEDLPVVVEI